MRGLPTFSVDVKARVARASYGTRFNDPWCPLKHLPSDKFWLESRQAWYARDQMQWYIKTVSLFWYWCIMAKAD
jgi:hypothetical protein